MKKIALLLTIMLCLIPLSIDAASGKDGAIGCGGGSSSSGVSRYLTSLSATANVDETIGKIFVSVDLSVPADGTGFAALYRANKMICVHTFSLANEYADVEFDFDFDGTYEDYESEYKIKIFALDNFLKPLALCKEAELEKRTVTINSDKINEKMSEGNRLYYYDENGNSCSVKLAGTFDVCLNGGDAQTATSVSDLYSILKISESDVITSDVELTLHNADTKCDLIVATRYSYDEIASTAELEDNDWRIRFESGASTTLCFSEADTQIVLEDSNDNAILPSELAEGDVVAYYTNGTVRNFTYMKMVKIADSAIEGTVDSVGSECIYVDGKKYSLTPELIGEIGLGTKGVFYIGVTGKISYFAAAQPEYAYILDAVHESNLDDVWKLRLLTAHDGVKNFNIADNAVRRFRTYFENLSSNGEKALFTDADFDKGNEYRLITYELNDNGEISSFAKADGSFLQIAADSTYNALSNRLGKNYLDDVSAVYFVNAESATETCADDVSALETGKVYGGYFFENENGEITALIITCESSSQEVSNGLAVVKSVDSAAGPDRDEVFVVRYFSDGEEKTMQIDKNTENLSFGDIFAFEADSNGNVQSYEKCGQISNGVLKPYPDKLNTLCDGRTEYIYGYIANSIRQMFGGEKENLTVYADGKTTDIITTDKTSKYTIVPQDNEIFAGSFMDGHDTVYYKEGDNSATMVFIKIVDDDVTDIYSFDTRVSVDNNNVSLNGNAVDTLYIK